MSCTPQALSAEDLVTRGEGRGGEGRGGEGEGEGRGRGRGGAHLRAGFCHNEGYFHELISNAGFCSVV